MDVRMLKDKLASEVWSRLEGSLVGGVGSVCDYEHTRALCHKSRNTLRCITLRSSHINSQNSIQNDAKYKS
jgi:hypothetical protein